MYSKSNCWSQNLHKCKSHWCLLDIFFGRLVWKDNFYWNQENHNLWTKVKLLTANHRYAVSLTKKSSLILLWNHAEQTHWQSIRSIIIRYMYNVKIWLSTRPQVYARRSETLWTLVSPESYAHRAYYKNKQVFLYQLETLLLLNCTDDAC